MVEPTSEFMRSIEDSAGTVTLVSGLQVRGWVTQLGTGFFWLLVAGKSESPSSGRETEERTDDDEIMLVREAAVAAWAFAGEDGW